VGDDGSFTHQRLCLPWRRSRVRILSFAPSKAPLSRGFLLATRLRPVAGVRFGKRFGNDSTLHQRQISLGDRTLINAAYGRQPRKREAPLRQRLKMPPWIRGVIVKQREGYLGLKPDYPREVDVPETLQRIEVPCVSSFIQTQRPTGSWSKSSWSSGILTVVRTYVDDMIDGEQLEQSPNLTKWHRWPGTMDLDAQHTHF